MPVTDDIVATYRAPGRVQRRLQEAARGEERAFLYLVAALVLFFVARAPGLARAAFLAPEVTLTQRMVAALLGILAMIPVFYLLAGLSHLAARAFGGRGSFLAARIALFWALLASAPLVLLQGLVGGFVGGGGAASATGLVVFAVFLWFWFAGWRAAEFAAGQEAGAS